MQLGKPNPMQGVPLSYVSEPLHCFGCTPFRSLLLGSNYTLDTRKVCKYFSQAWFLCNSLIINAM